MKENTKALIYLGILALFVFALTKVANICTRANENTEERIAVEETPITIEFVKPEGELYLCSSLEDDKEEVTKTEGLVLKKKHTFVMIMREKCSYKIDLKKIKYKQGNSDTMYVKLPKPEYVSSTQNIEIKSDDEGYWKKALPSTNKLKNKIERKIRKRFDTEENKIKAEAYAEASITEILEQLGYKAVIIKSINQIRK